MMVAAAATSRRIICTQYRFPPGRSGSRQNNVIFIIIRCQHPFRLPFVLDR